MVGREPGADGFLDLGFDFGIDSFRAYEKGCVEALDGELAGFRGIVPRDLYAEF
jgi:hypothetical protein